ncbi:MAG: DegT/DnrJ/EryC1/StrS family aminotransferase [Planctomycetaceae bacterium]|jgi:dTDP-4-amino-4,6-dideoxygalactose transaminase|nr:DegT/DnrJ/EryC1/StrS family aminotransferase [Planctomycetaceae bacterium]
MKGNFNSSSSTASAAQSVALLDLSRQYNVLKDEMLIALKHVCDSGQFVLGPTVVELEHNIASYCQVDHAVGCASGSDALLLALMVNEIGKGDEVIVPSFTFFATVSAVTRLGATPVFADIDPVTFNIEPNEVRRLVTSRTKAIMPVHLFGQMADMIALNDIAHSAPSPILVVEDAAQSIGAELDGRRAGSWGDMTALSFYPTKNLGGAGDGGMVVTRDAELAKKLRLYRGHGMEPRYYHSVVGINSRLDAFQAAILNVKMQYLENWSQQRDRNAQRYSELFSEHGLADYIVLPQTKPNRRHVWNQYTIRVLPELRTTMRQYLSEKKIGSEIYYPLGVHEQKCYTNLGYDPQSLPETYRASREVVALPIYPELTEQEQVTVVQGIKTFFDENVARKLYPSGLPSREAA